MYRTEADHISLSPLKNDVKRYTSDIFHKDLMSGIEVALLTVPQAMAYSLVANLPISCGLMAAIFSAIIGALMSSSRYLVIGPVNAIAILVQAGTADILYSYYREAAPIEKEVLAIEIMTQIALIAGVLQVLIATFKLGRLTQFVSHSVVTGYLAGGAFAIIVGQLFTFTALPQMEGINSLYEKLIYVASRFHDMDLLTILWGGASVATLLLFKSIPRRLPAAALMIALAIATVYFLKFTPFAFISTHISLVGDNADSFSVLPLFSFPSFNASIMNHMLSVAFAVALLGIIETTCTAKSIAATSLSPISLNQEIFAVGTSNLVSSFTGSIPVSVSQSRSQLNFLSGAETRFSAVMAALIVAFIVIYLEPLVHMTPSVTLAALLFVTAMTLVNSKQLLLCLKSTTSDAFVLITTFLACVFFALDTAFYIGVALSISLYLKRAAVPQLVEYEIDDAGELHSLDLPRAYLQKTIRVIKVEGELFFGSADIFYTTLKSLAEDDQTTRVIVLQLKNARDIDATTCLALFQLHEYMQRAGRYLVMCGMTHDIWEVMSHSGLIEKLGKANLFIFDEKHPQVYMQKAIFRAKELANLPIACKIPTAALAIKSY